MITLYKENEDGFDFEYEVDKKDFYKNKLVKELYIYYFADKYDIDESAAESIIKDYDLYEDYIIDDDIIDYIIKNHKEELLDEFYEYYEEQWEEVNLV